MKLFFKHFLSGFLSGFSYISRPASTLKHTTNAVNEDWLKVAGYFSAAINRIDLQNERK